MDITTKKLLKLLNKNKEKDEEVETKKDLKQKGLERFIQTYNIQRGRTFVPTYKIYYEYCINWKPDRKKLSKVEFFRRFGGFFDKKRNGAIRYYLLNESSFNISEESLLAAKMRDKKAATRLKNIERKRKKTKKKNKKKSNKISRTRKKV